MVGTNLPWCCQMQGQYGGSKGFVDSRQARPVIEAATGESSRAFNKNNSVFLEQLRLRSVDWTLSVISHGHGASVNRLLGDLRSMLDPSKFELIVTINCPEPVAVDPTLWPGAIEIVRNERPQGFARNHNVALSNARGRFVAVLDPDLRLNQNPFPSLTEFLQSRPHSLAAPHVLDSDGNAQDNMRRLLTPVALWRRYGLRKRKADYGQVAASARVDWIAGLFMATSRDYFERHQGFDESFHLYCEDTELCLRYWIAGGEVWSLPLEGVVHNARRRTLIELRHFIWHCQSILRLWSSRTFWRYLSRYKSTR